MHRKNHVSSLPIEGAASPTCVGGNYALLLG
jgi:hypothetical protein